MTEKPEDQVIVLMAAPGKAVIDDAVLAEVISAVAPFNPELRWLDEEGHEACEVAFTPPPASHYQPRSLEERLRGRLMGRPIDVAVLPLGGRRKRLLVADMDSTIIAQECIDELAAAAGKGEEVAAITERTMRGEIPFRESLRQRVAHMAGLREDVLSEVIENRICINPGAAVLVATMKAHGAKTALISGGFAPFARHVAETLGFDVWRANELKVENGRLTGEVIEPALGKDAKLEIMKELAAEMGIGLDAVLAVGDGANDVEMVRAAGLGVAWHAKPVLRDVADARIDYADLSSLLYLQGYMKSDFCI